MKSDEYTELRSLIATLQARVDELTATLMPGTPKKRKTETGNPVFDYAMANRGVWFYTDEHGTDAQAKDAVIRSQSQGMKLWITERSGRYRVMLALP